MQPDLGSLESLPEEAVSRKLDHWITRLYDMSRRNRLLYFRPTRASTARIIHPSPTKLYDLLVVRGKTLTFPQPEEHDNFDGDEDEEQPVERTYRSNEIGVQEGDRRIARVLYNLRSRSTTARQEQGVNVLYLAFGFLRWYEAVTGGEPVKAPLLLVPVELRREGVASPYVLSMFEDDVVVNPSLQVKLQNDFNLELPSFPPDGDSEDLEKFWRQVAELVRGHTGWGVEPEVFLSIFSFQNLVIVADLERNRARFLRHHLVQRLADPESPLPFPETPPPSAEELDDRVPPESMFQVLDADSSQQEAIEAAKAGMSFVLQGPPGTGKSQTIANIIAEFLAAGKRVLFVSQKIAALEVVRRRLDQVGLGDFCLEVHSHRRDKREVVAELGHNLLYLDPGRGVRLDRTAAELKAARDRLNAYVRALHRPRFALEISAFQAYGELARLKEAPVLQFSIPDLEHMTIHDRERYVQLVGELAAYPQVIDYYSEHPWRGCVIDTLTIDLSTEIETRLSNLIRDLETLHERATLLARAYGVEAPACLQHVADLLHVASVFNPGVLHLPVEEIRHRYVHRYRSALRYLMPAYWKDSGTLKAHSRDGRRVDTHLVPTVLGHASKVKRRMAPQGGGPGGGPSVPAQVLLDIRAIAARVNETRAFLVQLFAEEEAPEALANFYTVEIPSLLGWARRQLAAMRALSDWVGFRRLRLQAEREGLAPFIAAALDSGCPADQWRGAFARRLYSLLVDAIVQSDPELQAFQSPAHELLIERFRELDQEYISQVRRAIRARLIEQRPQDDWMRATNTEGAILRRELNKRRRLKPLRLLFSQIPDLILRLKPCLMMSPLTVSQLLDPDLYQFDLAIFDEASQIPPEYAVGTFIRASQVVIAGDRHQLPPTRFFEALESDSYDDEIDDFESVLNECDAAGMPSKMLRWHYRSRDETLIAFSNFHFYGNRLFTFPSAQGSDQGTGLEFIHVPDGVYQRGRSARYNLVEARRVVDLVIQHMETTPHLSLGVVTFSQAQREAIELELDRTLRERPDLHPLFRDEGEEPFFVKNLEQVQGDERDVIFFSVGYGFDETGRFILNFGPLNRQGGERRLNVAVTRARRKVKLVASFEPEDIDLSRTNSQGVHLLRSYMTVARDGPEALHAAVALDADADFESPFEASVYEALTSMGIPVRKQVGVSGYRIDLAIVNPTKPGQYLLGIECDGAMYHSAATARDRDRLRQQVLEGLGWRIHRIWSRDWVEDKDREIEKVLNAAREAYRALGKAGGSSRAFKGAQPSSTRARPSPREVEKPRRPRKRTQPASASPTPSGTQPYRRARLPQAPGGVRAFYHATTDDLIQAFQEVVKIEGPIHLSLAKRRVAEKWGIRRLGKKVQAALDEAVEHAVNKRRLRRRGDFLWPRRAPAPLVRLPVEEEDARSIEEIPPEEIREAVMVCVASALSLEEEELIRETARLYGLRATQQVRDAVKGAVQTHLRAGRLERRGGRIRTPRTP